MNREEELGALRRWWGSGGQLGLVWGRQRVGKSWLMARFAEQVPRSVVHAGATRPLVEELRVFSAAAARAGFGGARDLRARPYSSWAEALGALSSAGSTSPVLLVLDELPELLRSDPSLGGVLRDATERVRPSSPLRVLLCGSDVRAMEALTDERGPFHGHVGLRLPVHPLRPHEAGRMLAGLAPQDRALVWALLGGVPLYLSWWDQERSVRDNLAELVCTPGGRLLDEGRLVMASQGEPQGLAGPVLAAIAAGHTKFSQIGTAVRTDPTRVLERLVESQLVRRVVPVAAAAPSGGRRRLYEVADNFLAFWLGLVSPHRAEIDRGLGASALLGMLASLDDFLSARWEEAFREHLRRLAAAGELGDVLAVGPNWSGADDKIDAVCIAGQLREAVLVGAARWAREIDASLLEPALARRSATLPRVRDPLRLAVCARERVTGAGPSTLTVTAEDIFA